MVESTDPHTSSAAAASPLPRVSVVLTSRDRERWLDLALAGLSAQTYPRLELLLVDDGSRDGTAAILDRFAAARPDARRLSTGGIGPAGARAAAFEVATGDLFALQDDDDVSLPRRIEFQVGYLLRHPEIVLVGTAAEIIDEHGARLALYPLPVDQAAIRRALARKAPFVHGSVMMRREAYRKAGGYRRVFPVAEDYDLYLRLASIGGLANLAEPLYQWRLHPGNTLAQREWDHFFFTAAARAFDDERRKRGHDSAAELERLGPEAFLETYPEAGRLLAHLGEAYARSGRTGEARRHLARALRHSGARGRALLWSAIGVPWALARRARGIRATRGFVVPRS